MNEPDLIEKTETDVMDILQKAHDDGVSWERVRWLVSTMILPNLTMKVIAEKGLKEV